MTRSETLNCALRGGPISDTYADNCEGLFRGIEGVCLGVSNFSVGGIIDYAEETMGLFFNCSAVGMKKLRLVRFSAEQKRFHERPIRKLRMKGSEIERKDRQSITQLARRAVMVKER